MKNYARVIVGAALAVLCLYFAFRGIDFRELGRTLAQAEYGWIVPAMLAVLASMIFRTFRWRCLLLPAKRIGYMDLFSALNICFMANNFLPARSGEFIRSVLIGKKHGVNISTVLATVVLERIFDALCVMALFLILLFSYTVDEKLKRIGTVLVVAYFCLLAVLLIARICSQSVQRGLHRFLSKFSSSFAHKMCNLVDSFLQGLNALRDWKQVALIIMHSVFVWIMILLTYYFLCLAFGISMPPIGYVFLVCALAIAVMAPIPGYVGSFHAAYKASLEVFGSPANMALGCAIVAHGSQYVFISVLGVLCLWREGVSFRSLKAEEREAEMELGHLRAGACEDGNAPQQNGREDAE